MKFLCAVVIAVTCVSIGVSADGRLQCTLPSANITSSWSKMDDPCVTILKAQVKKEIEAAMTYLAMGAYFARDTVNRPGFSKLFIESASEEREHAIKVIEYLLMRGQLTTEVHQLLAFPLKPRREVWTNGVDALRDALKLETEVTGKILGIIQTCEKPKNKTFINDYHLVDYLTGVFLDEQYKGERDLAGKISTLDKMMLTYGPLGEFLFDKKLLENAV